MNETLMVALYKQFLKFECLRLGLGRDDLDAVEDIESMGDVLALAHFLIDAYNADRARIQYVENVETLIKKLYLADDEAYDEFGVRD